MPNPFALLINILLRPSKWQATITAIDPNLPPEFSLIELSGDHWRVPALRRLLVNGYLVLPLLLFGACSLGHLLFGRSIAGVIAAFAFTVVIGLTFGIIVSAAVGVTVLAIVGTSAAILWPDQRVILFDMLFSVRYAYLFGLSNALVLIVVANCTRHATQGSLRRQIGGVVLGMLVSLVIMAGATYLILTIIRARQADQLPGNSVGIVLTLLPTLLLGTAAYFQSRSLRKTGAVALLTALLFMLCFGRIGSEYGLEFGGNELLLGMSAVIISLFFILCILPFAITRSFVGTWPAAVAAASGGLAIYIPLGVVFSLFIARDNLLMAGGLLLGGLGFGWLWSGAVYLFEAAWNTLLYQLDRRHDGPIRWLHYHAAFWDEIQQFPFFELDDYLVMAVERGRIINDSHDVRYTNCTDPHSTDLQSEMLIRAVDQGNQQWAVQAARAELDARRLERLDSVEALASISDDAAAGLLSTPAGLMLRNFTQFGGDVAAALAQPSPYNQRLVLNSVTRDLENLQSELGRDGANQLAVRYQSVAHHWHTVTTAYVEKLDQLTRANQEIPNPYIVGVPLTRRQEIFVGRTSVARYVEDILRQGDHPPLLLYGPRRMGKTSLLYQLHWMLPRRILPLVVDLQGPVSLASTNVGFLHALARGIRIAAARNEIILPDLTLDQLAQEPFTFFDDWLNQIGIFIAADNRDAVLIALDEFEALDAALSSGQLEERAVLGMLRHIVQHRSGIKLLLSGSHTLNEFRRWSSYLINAQVVELGYLEEAEARQLIETPTNNFPLRYERDALQHVLDLTSGHPYLVQLLCMEIVARKNRQDQATRHLVIREEIEASVPAMLERGQQFFADIELNQTNNDGRLALQWLANRGAGYFASADEFAPVVGEQKAKETIQQLVRRGILGEQDSLLRFEVEAVRRWFAQS